MTREEKAIAVFPNENPVDFLIRQFGMTRAHFTKHHGFGENHLLLVAQGRKESIGDMLEAALYKEADRAGINLHDKLYDKYGFEDLDEAFWFWRLAARQRAQMPDVRPGVGSPMARFVRAVGSIAQTAKLLRVRDIMVRKYMGQPEMPDPIRQAFLDIEGTFFIDDFDRRQKAYFKDKGRKR